MMSVIFDLDGTLVESAAAIRDVANQLMGELGLEPLTLPEVRSFIGAGTPIFLERALTSRDALPDRGMFSEHHSRLMALYNQAPGEANVPMPGADAVLRQLHSDGVRLGLCTNKSAGPTETVLRANAWSELFSTVIAGDTLPERKPDPTPLREAARRLELTPAFYVGDSEYDATAAAAANMPFLLYTEGYRKSEISDMPHAATFSDFAALPDLITDLAQSR